MKKYGYGILIVLIALSFAVSGVALTFLPDTVALHYNFEGVANRFGSKFELLIIPVMGAVFAVIMVLIVRLAMRFDHTQSDKERALTEKIVFWTAIFEVLLFSGMGLYSMWKGATYTPGDVGPAAPAGFLRFVGIGTGVLFVFLGNFMPKARRNAFYGLRTKWSMADDAVWQKCQRFGGISAVALGFVMIVTGIFMESPSHLILCMAVVTVWAGLCIGMSYRFYKQAGGTAAD